MITREEWLIRILPSSLQASWDKPDELYGFLVNALRDGFRSEIADAAEHLYRTDPQADRAACLWGIILMEEGRLDEADAVFGEVTARIGERGFILTNWAKVDAARGNHAQSEARLWHALELDPNQENALGWYTVIHRERGGIEAEQVALRRVAAVPGSWRARLWLGRHSLSERQLDEAVALYKEAIALAPRPLPADMLMQISGDLGKQGHLPEILQLCEPFFDPAHHGILAGNNLIKANLDLGRIDRAAELLNALYAQKRPDWQQNLSFWDTAIADARIGIAAKPAAQPSVSLTSLNEPIWLRSDSPANALFAAKETDAPIVAFLGSSVKTGLKEVTVQRADGPGRLSRALPLLFLEQIHLTTTGHAVAITPWMQDRAGFVVIGMPWEADSAGHARQLQPPADFAVMFHLVATEEPWQVDMVLYRTIDGAELGRWNAHFTSAQPATALAYLLNELRAALHREGGFEPIPHPLYEIPQDPALAYYLLRLEQALAVSMSRLKPGDASFLSGERDIMAGMVGLNLDHPACVNARLLLLQTAKIMKSIRPEIFEEFREKIALLQKEKPLGTSTGEVTGQIWASLLVPAA